MRIRTKLRLAKVKFAMTTKRRGITHVVGFGALALLLGVAAPAAAHPVPFSYLDISIEPGGVTLTLVEHMFVDVNELIVDPPARMLVPYFLGHHHTPISSL